MRCTKNRLPSSMEHDLKVMGGGPPALVLGQVARVVFEPWAAYDG